MFDHRCLRSIGKIWWEHRISNTEVRRRVLGPKNMSIIEQLHNHRLRWLGHVLRMSDDRLPRRALFAEPKSSWKRPSGGQHMTWQRNMKSLTDACMTTRTNVSVHVCETELKNKGRARFGHLGALH